MVWAFALVALTGFSTPDSVPIEVAVFLRVEATEEQRKAVIRRLSTMPQATGLVYVSRQDAYAEFSEMLNGAPVPVEARDLPESFRFHLPDERAFNTLRAALTRMPGVHTVVCRPGRLKGVPPGKEGLGTRSAEE